MVTGHEQQTPEVQNVPPPHFVPQTYAEAGPYAALLRETPQTVEQRFRWATHLIQPSDISRKFREFAKRAEFPVSGETLTRSCMDEFNFCKKVYETVLFPMDSPQLSYHNEDHALITSITAQKIFLGALTDAAKKGAISLVPPERIDTLHKLITAVSAFHEIDDWWSLPYPGQSGTNPHLTQAKIEIVEHLTQLGLSSHDFNRLLLLDDFRESQEACLAKGLALQKGEGFLQENQNDSVLDSLTPEERGLVMTAASNALSASDFLQVINPAYLQPIDLIVEDHTFQGYAGPYALAAEMSQWRKKALEMARFGTNDGTVDWEHVEISLGFFEKMALPRIHSGIIHLKTVAPAEYSNAQEVLNAIHTLLKQQAERKQTMQVQNKLQGFFQ